MNKYMFAIGGPGADINLFYCFTQCECHDVVKVMTYQCAAVTMASAFLRRQI